MIVTRQRQKRFNWGRVFLPLAAIAALAFAVTWPPSRNIIVNGPLRPMWGTLGNVATAVVRPFTFVAQQQQIADQKRNVRALNDKLEAERRVEADKTAQLAGLRAQVAQLQAKPVPTEAPAVAAMPKASPTPIGAGITGGASTADADISRVAKVWSAMDADRAAAVVRKLPEGYVNRVFAQMSPDAVGPILEALPADVAARIVASGGSTAAGR